MDNKEKLMQDIQNNLNAVRAQIYLWQKKETVLIQQEEFLKYLIDIEKLEKESKEKPQE